MNLLLHGVRPEKMSIRNGDTLQEDWPENPNRPSEGVQFDGVVMNPPYSVKNWNQADLKVSDPRFEVSGVLPPNSKGDYAFLLHGLYHLGQEGTMAIVLPHGVLFRGGTEGHIRQRLLEKNYIDTIIGLPDKLFTNTGIPVTVIILKKNRELNAPVLMIDASHTFIKEGKQNVLREKDIAKLVDTYVTRSEETGYSHLATREEIIENDYNLNIPRYIESIDEDIPEDVDAHLLGGIPYDNIAQLSVIQSTVPDVINEYLEEIRVGYVSLTASMDGIRYTVLSAPYVKDKSKALTERLKHYQDKYWPILKSVEDVDEIRGIREAMVVEIKDILLEFDHIDEYDGYQVIANIWQEQLMADTEVIAMKDFYTEGRKSIPRMVTKGEGNKKREVQDGWIGSLIPNELIKTKLFNAELTEIETKEIKLQDIEATLTDLVEAAKVEESD